MVPKLTGTELGVVRQYLGADRSGREPQQGLVWLASVTVAVSGLVLAAYATTLFLQNPTDHVATSVLLPVGGAGIFLILVGVGILTYASRSRERVRLGAILRKLLTEELPSQRR